MKLKKTKSIALLAAALTVLVVFGSSPASDSVEWSVLETLQLDAAPLDVVVAGRRIFVLTEQGEILVYSSPKKLEARVRVGDHVDRMKLGPRGEILILTSRDRKTVQFVALDFIQKINVSGSPFKGPEGAPVVIAVFSDFQ